MAGRLALVGTTRISAQGAAGGPLTAAATKRKPDDQGPQGSGRTAPAAPTVSAEAHTAVLQAATRKVDKLEPRLAAIIETILNKYGRIAAQNFEKHVTRHLTAADVPMSPDWTSPFPDQLINVDALVQEILAKTQPIREALIRETMTPAMRPVGLNFDTKNPLISGQIANTGAQVTNIADTTRANIMNIVGQAATSGLTVPQTSSLIQTGMKAASKSRATMIARTELGRAVSGASLAATQLVSNATGDAYDKTWLTAPGATYPRHETYDGLDGQTVALEEAFDVGGEELQYPGDPGGDPSETINCRCAMSYKTPEGEMESDADSPPELDTMDTAGGGGGGGPIQVGPPAGDTVSIGAGAPVPEHLVTRINELGLDKPLDQFKPSTDVGRRIFGVHPDTRSIYAPDGVYAEERQRLHDDIVNAFFKDKVSPEGGGDNYFFTAGGGASGKGSATFMVDGVERSLKELNGDSNWIVIDPDRVKKMLPEYQALKKENDFYAANGVHEESSDLAARITAEAKARGFNIVEDTTGSSEKFLTKIDKAKAEGYHTQVTMFSNPTNRAIERAIARAENPDSSSYGRYVALQPLKKAHAGASRNLAIWQDSPNLDEWRLFDNSGEAPREIASGGANVDKVINDPETFSQILAKADEKPGTGGVRLLPAEGEVAPAISESEALDQAVSDLADARAGQTVTPAETLSNETSSLDPGKADIDAALAAMGEQIRVPAGPPGYPLIKAKVTGAIDYAGNPDGLFAPIAGNLQVKRLTDRYAVFTHEYGHAFDALSSEPGRKVPVVDPSGTVLDHRSEVYASQNIEQAGLGDWYAAIQDSPTYQKLQEALLNGTDKAAAEGKDLMGTDLVEIDGEHYYAGNIRYAMNEQELWARSFVQYLSQKDERLAAHVAEKLALPRQPVGYWYWKPEEFAPIKAAMDSYFREKGLLVAEPPIEGAEVAPSIDHGFRTVAEVQADDLVRAAAPEGLVNQVPDLIPGQSAASQASHEQNLSDVVEKYARDTGMTEDAYRAAAEQVLRDAVGENPEVRMRVTPGALERILSDGRFKSQFETNTSRGTLDTAARTKAESEMFGYPKNLDPEKRPIYGYLAGSSDERSGLLSNYGDIQVRMKPEVNARTTFTTDDSLYFGANHYFEPSGILEPDLGSWGFGDIVKVGEEKPGDLASISPPGNSEPTYAEAQIHGGVKTSDIGEVIFSRLNERDMIDGAESTVRHYKWSLAEAREAAERGDEGYRGPSVEDLEASLAHAQDYYTEASGRFDAIRATLDAAGIPWRIVDEWSEAEPEAS